MWKDRQKEKGRERKRRGWERVKKGGRGIVGVACMWLEAEYSCGGADAMMWLVWYVEDKQAKTHILRYLAAAEKQFVRCLKSIGKNRGIGWSTEGPSLYIPNTTALPLPREWQLGSWHKYPYWAISSREYPRRDSDTSLQFLRCTCV